MSQLKSAFLCVQNSTLNSFRYVSRKFSYYILCPKCLVAYLSQYSFPFLAFMLNELAILEFIHLLVETMDRHFGNVVSLHSVMFLNYILVYFLSPEFNFPCFSFKEVDLVSPVSFYLNLQCELDIMFHLEKAHFMLEEMVMNGCIVETSKTNILQPIQLMEKSS